MTTVRTKRMDTYSSAWSMLPGWGNRSHDAVESAVWASVPLGVLSEDMGASGRLTLLPCCLFLLSSSVQSHPAGNSHQHGPDLSHQVALRRRALIMHTHTRTHAFTHYLYYHMQFKANPVLADLCLLQSLITAVVQQADQLIEWPLRTLSTEKKFVLFFRLLSSLFVRFISALMRTQQTSE